MSPRSHGLSPRVPLVPESLSRSFDRRVLRIAPLVPPAYDPLYGQGANGDGLSLGPASASRRAPLLLSASDPNASASPTSQRLTGITSAQHGYREKYYAMEKNAPYHQQNMGESGVTRACMLARSNSEEAIQSEERFE